MLGLTLTLAAKQPQSHPLRPLPQASDRPLAEGPAFYADADQGRDQNNGSQDSPWKTISHGLTQISAGDTLLICAVGLTSSTFIAALPVRLTNRSLFVPSVAAYTI